MCTSVLLPCPVLWGDQPAGVERHPNIKLADPCPWRRGTNKKIFFFARAKKGNGKREKGKEKEKKKSLRNTAGAPVDAPTDAMTRTAYAPIDQNISDQERADPPCRVVATATTAAAVASHLPSIKFPAYKPHAHAPPGPRRAEPLVFLLSFPFPARKHKHVRQIG